MQGCVSSKRVGSACVGVGVCLCVFIPPPKKHTSLLPPPPHAPPPIHSLPTQKKHSQQIAPDGIGVWNPGFDVTAAALITGGIVTEKGVIPLGGAGGFDVRGFWEGR